MKYTRACEYHIGSFDVGRDDRLAIWPTHARRRRGLLEERQRMRQLEAARPAIRKRPIAVLNS